LAELFAREVLDFLVHKQLLNPGWADHLRTFRHTGFNVHSRVRAQTKTEPERVGNYMVRPFLSLERLFLDERTGRVGYGLTALPAEIYTLSEWIKGQVASKRYTQQAQPKSKLLYLLEESAQYLALCRLDQKWIAWPGCRGTCPKGGL